MARMITALVHWFLHIASTALSTVTPVNSTWWFCLFTRHFTSLPGILVIVLCSMLLRFGITFPTMYLCCLLQEQSSTLFFACKSLSALACLPCFSDMTCVYGSTISLYVCLLFLFRICQMIEIKCNKILIRLD